MILADRQKLAASTTRLTTITVDTADTVLVKADANRVALTIGPPLTNPIYVVFGQTAALLTGIRLNATSPPLVLTLATAGNAVLGEWRAIAATAAEAIGVMENLLIH